MDKKFIKKNQFTFFIIGFFLILLILLLLSKDMLFANDDGEKYGNRLDEIVEVNEQTLTDLKTSFEEKETVKKLSTDIKGKIINIIITVNDDMSVKNAEDLGNTTVSSFSPEILSCYDIQVFVKKESEAENNFPIIGYKSKNKETFTWTREREKVTETSEEE